MVKKLNNIKSKMSRLSLDSEKNIFDTTSLKIIVKTSHFLQLEITKKLETL